MNKITVLIDIKEESSIFTKMEGYGCIIDSVCEFNQSFEGGKMYVLVGGCGSGGWGISCLLCGKEFDDGGTILVNDCSCSQDDLKRYGWYVGEGLERRYSFLREKSVIEQIRHGLKITSKCEEREIIKKFGLSKLQSGIGKLEFIRERWRASLAIGYAHDYKIFCFPWLNSRNMRELIEDNEVYHFFEILKEEGGIIIMPTQKDEFVTQIADKVIKIKNRRHVVTEKMKGIVRDYYKEGNRVRETKCMDLNCDYKS